MQNTNKIHIQHLAEICAQKGITQVVLSPGSRCAPLVIAFNRHPSIECFSIVDERSAAFFALGLAQQSKKPVALVCTSGSAVLNYAPAVAEAFYQKVALVLLTADRPNEWIDQGENQSIQQFEVFKNYIKKSYQLPVNVSTKEDLWYCDRLISEALNNAVYPSFGPVHINIPLREPLYQLTANTIHEVKLVDMPNFHTAINEVEQQKIDNIWNSTAKKMIVVGGQKQPNKAIEKILFELSQQEDVVVLHESISNFEMLNSFGKIDSLIEYINSKNLKTFVPDLIITFGNGVVSKKLKFWLRNNGVKHHWHISNNFEHWDNFQALTKVLQTNVLSFFKTLKYSAKEQKTYFKLWQDLEAKISKFSDQFIEKTAYSDFKVFDKIMKSLPKDTNVHFGNSTPVRYANLLDIPNKVKVNANRGVSGIDGQVSTALGASLTNHRTTICITGDLAMMYDSNAFWNNYLHPNFKVILINNKGGNIFRIIPGPSDLDELENYFETKNTYDAYHLAKLHNLAYFKIKDESEFDEKIIEFYAENTKTALLEIETNGKLSAKILQEYFKKIKEI